MNDKKLKNELWNILPYAGQWYAGICGKITEFKIPQEQETYLIGTPYSGDNTGANPDLRLITFTPNSLNGPIVVAGVQQIFFNNLLNHTVKWKIEPISRDIDTVKIGFYTFNYVNRDLGDNRLIPLITTEGPAFYKTKSNGKGVFETTEFNNMYIIVDANVSVKMWVSYTVPKVVDNPCLTKLFELYYYTIGRGDCKEVVAESQLINQQTLATLLRPVDKYINLSQRMISYLIDKAVTVTIFESTTPSVKSLKVTAPVSKVYENVPFKLERSEYRERDKKVRFSHILDTTGFELSSEFNSAFSVGQKTGSQVRIEYVCIITSPEDGGVSVLSSQIYQFNPNSSNIVGPKGYRWDSVYEGEVNKDPYIQGITTEEGLNNVTLRFDESRTYDNATPVKACTIVAKTFTITVL